jgi:hypothetical protein
VQQTEFLKFNELGSLAGLTAAVYLLTTAIVATGMVNAKWVKSIALGLAVGLAMLFVALTTPTDYQAYVIGLVNGAMAFLSATGLSAVVAAGGARSNGVIMESVAVSKGTESPISVDLPVERMWWTKW